MGIDIPTRKELIAPNRTVLEICEELGLDSLVYLRLEDIYEVLGRELYHGCFSGKYPPGLLD